MEPVDGVARESVEDAFVEHRPCSAQTLFSGLKDEVDRASELGVLGQISSGPQKDSGMPVMATGVSYARGNRRVWSVSRFSDGQGIHISAETDAPIAALLAAQGADDSSSSDMLSHIDTPLA